MDITKNLAFKIAELQNEQIGGCDFEGCYENFDLFARQYGMSLGVVDSGFQNLFNWDKFAIELSQDYLEFEVDFDQLPKWLTDILDSDLDGMILVFHK